MCLEMQNALNFFQTTIVSQENQPLLEQIVAKLNGANVLNRVENFFRRRPAGSAIESFVLQLKKSSQLSEFDYAEFQNILAKALECQQIALAKNTDLASLEDCLKFF